MHNNSYYTNVDTGKFDHHAKKMAGKNRDQYSEDLHDLKRLTDGGNQVVYVDRVRSVLDSKTEGMKASRENTKLALTGNLAIRPYQQEVGMALRENRYSLTPAKQLPTPMKQPIALAI